MQSPPLQLSYAGFAAPLVYIATVAAGGWATEGYSQLSQPVSALFEAGAPHALPISLGFVTYNVLLVAFGVGLMTNARQSPSRLAAMAILINGAIGLAIELAPMDPIGASATLAGTIHLLLAGLLVLTCMIAMGLMAIAWWQEDRLRLVAVTVGLLVVMLATGPVAAMAAAQSWPLLGLYQRLAIGSYLVWLPMVAIVELRRPLSAG